MSLTTINLGDLIDGKYWLSVYCDRQTPPCHHGAYVDVMWLAGRVGRDYPCDARSLARIGWCCTKCGSKRVTFRTAGSTHYPLDPDPDKPF